MCPGPSHTRNVIQKPTTSAACAEQRLETILCLESRSRTYHRTAWAQVPQFITGAGLLRVGSTQFGEGSTGKKYLRNLACTTKPWSWVRIANLIAGFEVLDARFCRFLKSVARITRAVIFGTSVAGH